MLPLMIGLLGDDKNNQVVDFNKTFPVTLDDLTSEELLALQVEADLALANGTLDRINIETNMDFTQQVEGADMMGQRIERSESAADEAAESPEEQEMEQDQGTELHSTTEFVEQAQSGYAECEQMLEQLQELSAVIGDDENVSSLLDEMETAVKEAKDIADGAETAIESDDIHSAADAAAKIDELKATLSDAMSQVDSMRQEAASAIAGDGSFVSTKPAATSTTNSVSGYGSKGGSSSVPASKSDAPLSMWAKRMVGGMGRGR